MPLRRDATPFHAAAIIATPPMLFSPPCCRAAADFSTPCHYCAAAFITIDIDAPFSPPPPSAAATMLPLRFSLFITPPLPCHCAPPLIYFRYAAAMPPFYFRRLYCRFSLPFAELLLRRRATPRAPLPLALMPPAFADCHIYATPFFDAPAPPPPMRQAYAALCAADTLFSHRLRLAADAAAFIASPPFRRFSV